MVINISTDRYTENSLTYEQVEHDVGYDDVKWAEVDECSSIVATVRFPVSMFVWSAERSLHL